MKKLVQNSFHEVLMLSRFVVLLLLASCGYMNQQLSDFSDTSNMVQLEAYDYNTDEKAGFKTPIFPGYKLRVSDEKFYLKKTFKFTSDDIKLSQAMSREEHDNERQATADFINMHETILGMPSASE
jgi:hypothetical protein